MLCSIGRKCFETGRCYLNLEYKVLFTIAKRFATVCPTEHDPVMVKTVTTKHNRVFMCLQSSDSFCQVAQEKKAAEVKVASQDVVPAQSTEPLPGPGTTKLPVGGTYSSVHVDYNYFKVGTGQVNLNLCQDSIRSA